MHPSVPREVFYAGKRVSVLEYLHHTKQYRIMLEDGSELVVHKLNVRPVEDK